jgi:1-deoxy-D-xylulose-5-phosphate reductoisomerase
MGPVPAFDWDAPKSWTFEPPDLERFPCLALAYQALRQGGTAPAILNAANEEAVASFLEGRIGLWGIQACIRHALEKQASVPAASLDVVMDADRSARDISKEWIGSHAF